MKLPNWFKIVWWILILIFSGYLFFSRISIINSGKATQIDVFFFLIFIALLLIPLFSEVEIFGIKLKKEIESLKTELKINLSELKNEIRNSQIQMVSTTISGLGPPPPDDKLPELEEKIDSLVKKKLSEHGIKIEHEIKGRLDVPEDNLLMFKVRFNIEKEIKRIWEKRFKYYTEEKINKYEPITKMLSDLVKFEIIDYDLYGIVREILAICNSAIHGEEVSESKRNFVLKNAKKVIDFLSQTK